MSDDSAQGDVPDALVYTPSPLILWLRKYIWWIGGGLGLLMITLIRPFMIHRAPPPPVISQIPEFEMLDQDGEGFGLDDMDGQVWIVGFIFTRCPSQCPAITSAMVNFQSQLSRARIDDEVSLLSITVDPTFDSPEVLKDYAANVGADESNWRFVTAGEDEDGMENVVVGGFKVAVGEMEEDPKGALDIAHSSKLALVDRFGGVRGMYSIDSEGLNELFHRTLAVIRVREKG